jgi:hypothetical protein
VISIVDREPEFIFKIRKYEGKVEGEGVEDGELFLEHRVVKCVAGGKSCGLCGENDGLGVFDVIVDGAENNIFVSKVYVTVERNVAVAGGHFGDVL